VAGDLVGFVALVELRVTPGGRGILTSSSSPGVAYAAVIRLNIDGLELWRSFVGDAEEIRVSVIGTIVFRGTDIDVELGRIGIAAAINTVASSGDCLTVDGDRVLCTARARRCARRR